MCKHNLKFCSYLVLNAHRIQYKLTKNVDIILSLKLYYIYKISTFVYINYNLICVYNLLIWKYIAYIYHMYVMHIIEYKFKFSNINIIQAKLTVSLCPSCMTKVLWSIHISELMHVRPDILNTATFCVKKNKTQRCVHYIILQNTLFYQNFNKSA